MNRTRSSLSLVAALAVVLALAVAPAVSAATATDPGAAVVSAKRGAKKKKASTCTKRRAASKGKGKRGTTRRGVIAEASARGTARGKGGKGAKGRKRAKRCPAKRTTPKRDSGSGRHERPSRDPRERRREREEAKGRRRPTRPTPTAPAKVVPDDGTYTAAGLTFTISGDGSRGRIVTTVPKTDFSDAICQTEDVAVDVPVELSRSTGRSGVMGYAQLPGDVTVNVLGSVAADGSFSLSLSTLRPYVPNPGSTCAATTRLQGTLAR